MLPHSFIWALSALSLLVVASVRAEPPIGPTGIPLVQGSYVVIDLGSFGNTPAAQAFDLNDAPQVVGVSTASNGLSYGFIWERGSLRPLPTLSGGTPVTPLGVNSNGVVVGTAWEPQPVGGPLRRAFRWSAGPLQTLNLPADGGFPEALAINSSGLVAGSLVVTQAGPLGSVAITRPASWPANDDVSLLTSEPMANGRATSLNEAGRLVGTYRTGYPTSSVTHAVIFEGGGVRDLHAVTNHQNSVALGVNDSGQVVGYSYSTDTGVFDEPFFWSETDGMRRLPRPPLAPYGRALGITDNGLGVGDLRNDGPILWLNLGRTNETYVLVRGLLPRTSPYLITGPVAVNRQGEIAATALYEGRRAVLLTPTNLVDRIDGTFQLQTVSVETTNLYASTNLLADVQVELLGVEGTNLIPVATSWTDANGAFTLWARRGGFARYSVRLTLRDRTGWVDIFDASADTNQPAWLRTPAFDAGDSRRADVVLGINLDLLDSDPNDVRYLVNGDHLIVRPAGGAAAEEAASNAADQYFAHLAAIYRNLRLAARFAEEQLGLDMPRIRIEAFTPGYWEWAAWQATANANTLIRKGRWKPVSHFSRPSGGPNRIAFPDLKSLFNTPTNGFGVPKNTNGLVSVSQTTNRLTGTTALVSGTLCGRNRPDNREFHEYAHYIMHVSPISGVEGFPPRGTGNRNHAGLLNSTSTDSWAEGWAEFLSTVISEVMLDRTEKPVPSEYRSNGTTVNLDDLMTYTNVMAGNEAEELLVAALLWDAHDPADAVEGDSLSLGLGTWWSVLSETGPTLTNFQSVYGALADFAQQNPATLSPAGLDARMVQSFFFDDFTLPAGNPGFNDGLFSPGEVIGQTSWNPTFPHRREMEATRFLNVSAVTASAQPVAHVTYRVAIEYDPPFANRNRRQVQPTWGDGPCALPFMMPPLPSQALVTAWQGDRSALSPWVIHSTNFWQAVATSPDPETAESVFEHTFVFADLGPVLRVRRLPGGEIELSWEDAATRFHLEFSSALASPQSWTRVPDLPTLHGTRWVLIQAVSSQSRFYRLCAE